jgi:hypothetical protein
VFCHIFIKDVGKHRAALAVPGQKKRPALIIVFKVIVQGQKHTRARRAALYLKQFLKRAVKRREIYLPVIRGEYVRVSFKYCRLGAVYMPRTSPHILVAEFTDKRGVWGFRLISRGVEVYDVRVMLAPLRPGQPVVWIRIINVRFHYSPTASLTNREIHWYSWPNNIIF